MPLPQSQSFVGFGGYVGSGELVPNQCQKRKIGFERKQLEEVYENLDSGNELEESIPKRQCQWLSCESKTVELNQKETNGGDVNMEEDCEAVPVSEREDGSNKSNDQILSQCCQDEDREILESSASMDSDCTPSESQRTASHTPNRPSAPWSITQETVRRGLKPSPLSGRLYCHCSASWRGMYGLDAGYITDYY